MRRTIAALSGACAVFSAGVMFIGVDSASAAPAPVRQRYANCSAAHSDYPHGFRKIGSADRVRGVTPPVPSRLLPIRTPLYRLNTHLDRDRDGVACEAR